MGDLPDSCEPPPGWGDDTLTAYLEHAMRHRWATFAHYQPTVRNLARIDGQFTPLASIQDPPNLVTPHLGFRSHANFRAVCEHALAGQLGDMFPMVRACLEAAAYAVHLHDSPALTTEWLRRHDAQGMKAFKQNKFSQTAVRASIERRDPEVAVLYGELYQQAIDLGAHPNERGLSVNAKLAPTPEGKQFLLIYLHENGPQLRFALHSALEAGAAAIAMLRLVFPHILGPDEAVHRDFRTKLRASRPKFDEEPANSNHPRAAGTCVQ
jgi:hypothetical protein